MARVQEKIEAFKMRRSGASVKEIARNLKVGRSTVSLWVRDIRLSQDQKAKLHARMVAGGHKGRLLGAAMNREKRLERIRNAQVEALKTVRTIRTEDLFFLGLGLYWGEGTKSSSGNLSIVNSDPLIIRAAMEWFRKCLDVSLDRFRPRIFISDVHKGRADDILHFWSKTLNLPLSQFARTIFINRGKKIYENHKTYYGVLALNVLKGGELRTKILALIERIAAIQSRRSSRVRTRDS